KQTIVKPATDGQNKSDQKIAEPVTIQEMNDDNKEVVAEQKNIVEPKTDSIASNDVTKNEDPKETITKKKTGKPKIKWGIDFSAGVSGSNANLFSLDFQKSLRDALYANPGSSTGSGQRTILPPSSANSGFSFKTGIVAELQVSKKSRLLTGLQYAYSSSRISTSRRQDSVVYLYNNNFVTAQVNGYYRSVQQIKYTNRFHFIQVPLWYQWQFNKGKKLPLQWSAGLSFGYMVATNGLVYDTSYGGIYFHNEEAFNKFHVNAGTGLSLRLKGKNGSEWVFGPELWFDLKKLTNRPLDQKQYLMYGGINARFLLPQKKK
ncbi:MAG TPA: outer membrane beta-barrel protein, partial [Chitinophagaceae bacterium]|nr:outer membrane beta-barrel protein [Chitinophagaceae bacterium]